MRYDRMKNLLNKFMYHDYATICRQLPVVDDEGADDFTVEIIYSNIPCKLSQYGKEIISTVTDRQVDESFDFRITLDPDYDIRPNDIIKVLHRGQEFLLNAVKPFKYPTHQEISVRRKDEFTHELKD